MITFTGPGISVVVVVVTVVVVVVVVFVVFAAVVTVVVRIVRGLVVEDRRTVGTVVDIDCTVTLGLPPIRGVVETGGAAGGLVVGFTS